MNKQSLAILGSTGSIGQSTLRVIRGNPDRFRIVALAANSQVDLIEKQYHEFRPKYVCLANPDAALRLKERLQKEPVEILTGDDELIGLAGLDEVDIVLNAIVGAAGLKASVKTVTSGKQLALANKESLVAGGPLFADVCRKEEPQILPVDSEHSAIWQALRAGRRSEVRNIVLTASGGPFRTLPMEKFADITVEQALDHPTWKMGPKITIDSSTLVNKGLEVLEAMILFAVEPKQIKVVIHPQSIVHSMVEFVDSAVIAQLSEPDMCLPIACALFWPERLEQPYGQMDWSKAKDLNFEPPDFERFPALKLAFEVGETGGTAPAVYNAANEIAVAAFLKGAVGYNKIVDIIRKTLDEMEFNRQPDLEEILAADHEARRIAAKIEEKIAC